MDLASSFVPGSAPALVPVAAIVLALHRRKASVAKRMDLVPKLVDFVAKMDLASTLVLDPGSGSGFDPGSVVALGSKEPVAKRTGLATWFARYFARFLQVESSAKRHPRRLHWRDMLLERAWHKRMEGH